MTNQGPGSATSTPLVDLAEVEKLCDSSPDWLAQRRRAGWDAFSAMPMPSSQSDEDWRRTDVSMVQLEGLRVAATDKALATQAIATAKSVIPDCAVVNATPSEVAFEIPESLTAQGVIVCSLADAAARHAELLQVALSGIGVGESKFLSLWNAMQTNGTFICVPGGVDARVPVWISHTAGAMESERGTAVFPAVVIVLGNNSSLSVVESLASPNDADPLVSSAVTLFQLGRDARLDYSVIQSWGNNVSHFSTHRARLDSNAKLRFFGATLGSGLQKSYWEALLEGDGSEVDITGVSFGNGSQHLDHQSLQAHRAANTRSNLLLKSAVHDSARSVYSGLIDVERAAEHTDGYVQNRNLILSPKAMADSIPRLQIKAHDVKCGHGATAGHIDDDQRFYLRSRGIDSTEADRIIVRGFLDDALTAVKDSGLRAHIAELLEAKLASASPHA